MRVVIQRVSHCTVAIDGAPHSSIGRGLMVLVGIENSDSIEDIEWLSGKICAMRIFDDPHGVMNLSVRDIGGEIMVVSQFTLHASTKKGNRPSYIRASKADIAIPLYEKFKSKISQTLGRDVKSGIFGSDMKCTLLNDGPVTIVIDSKDRE